MLRVIDIFDLRKQSNYATELAASKGMTKEMAAHGA